MLGVSGLGGDLKNQNRVLGDADDQEWDLKAEARHLGGGGGWGGEV